MVLAGTFARTLSRLAVTLLADLHPLRLAAARVLGLATGVLDRKDTALDAVDQDILRLEVRVVAPRAEELNSLQDIVSVVFQG